MNPKFSLSIILTVGAFVLTLYLFGVCIVAYTDTVAPPGCRTTDDVSIISPRLTEKLLDHPGQEIFAANCKACHAINRKLVGPALTGVMDRYDSLWLISWIRNSSKMIADGDPTAVALFEEYNKTQMTSFTSFTDEELKNLLEYLQQASENEVLPMTPAVKVGV